jgi:hypothetical protein
MAYGIYWNTKNSLVMLMSQEDTFHLMAIGLGLGSGISEEIA